MRPAWLFALAIAVFAPVAATAQNIDRFLTVGSPAHWVDTAERPQVDLSTVRRDIDYLFVDRQVNHGAEEAHRYFRYVEALGTPTGVENNSAITIDFDPAYQTVTVHHLVRIRNGVPTDILDRQAFELYRVETERDRLIYDGSLQLSYLIRDVRVGDVLDYAFTIHGKNPAIVPHFAGHFAQGYSVPVRHHRNRLVVPTDTHVNFENHGNFPAPVITTATNTTSYVWETRDMRAIHVEDNIPDRLLAYPGTLYSTFHSWQEVGAHFAPYYDVSNQHSAAIDAIATDIRAKHSTQAEQLRAALDFVQSEIRYLGIALGGAGGFIPRDPDQVLSDRFGDCKDMAILLLAILAKLDIEAAPLLVNIETRDAVDAFLPSHRAFDHVIVSATLDGTTYHLDPTRGVQIGTLDHIQQGDFGKGVVVSVDGPGMIAAPAPLPDYFEDVRDTFDLVSEPGAALLTSVSTYHKGRADAMLSWYQSEGPERVDRNFFEYFQGLYPQIEQLSPLELTVDEELGSVSLTAQYRIPEAWTLYDDGTGEFFFVHAQDLSQDMPAHIATSRTLPFALEHPVRSRQTLVFKLDDTWAIDNSAKRIENAAFRFSNVEHFVNGIYVKQVSYQSKSNEIAAQDFRAIMDDLSQAEDYVGVTLQYTFPEHLDPIAAFFADVEDVETKIKLWNIFTILVSVLGALLLIQRQAVQRDGQRFYPVSLLKFTVLALITAGIYPVYWAYMNWRWLKHAAAQDVSPGWRAFFSSFTNFNLFQRMANTPDSPQWFRSAAIPLASVILLGYFANLLYNRTPDAPEALFLFATVCTFAWLPAVRHVNGLNADHPEILRAHSRFGWPAIGMIALFTPLTALMIYGYF
ncbi:MAG: DUF3857 domain-containing protein [Pseudomonadota bacterium]